MLHWVIVVLFCYELIGFCYALRVVAADRNPLSPVIVSLKNQPESLSKLLKLTLVSIIILIFWLPLLIIGHHR